MSTQGNTPRWQAVVAGTGGQGVLFVTRLIAQAAADKGWPVLISEVHGMAQRGGSVVSHLKLGDFSGPLVSQGAAELVLSLDAGEAVRNLGFLAPGAAMVVNAPGPEFLSDQARAVLSEREVRLVAVDAAGAATKAGSFKGANVATLAAAATAGALPISAQDLAATLERLSPPARQAANRELFQAGADLVG